MEKFWLYFGLISFGVIIGIILWEQINRNGTVFKGKIRIKQKGGSNTIDPVINAKFDKLTQRKQRRIIKRNARRKKKDLRKL